MRRFTLLATAAAALVLIASPASADVKKGVDAWQAARYDIAIAEWRPLAEKGDPDAQFNLGQAYRLGRGVPSDLKIAQSWYEKAAQQGHEQAQANLGLLLYEADRRSEALPWIQKAALNGDPRAQYVLGIELNNGDLLPKDWPRAYALMTLAAAQGIPPAAKSLTEMDEYIPAADRQQGLALAHQLRAKRSASADAPSLPSAPSAKSPAQPTRVAKAPAPPAVAAPSQAARTPSPKPAPKPQDVARAAPPATVRSATPRQDAPSGRWRVQLGAYSSAQAARGQWASLSKRISALSGLQPSYESAGALTRLRVGPVPSRAAADRLCGAAKAAGQACFPVAP
jgi:cell division protein FtsN